MNLKKIMVASALATGTVVPLAVQTPSPASAQSSCSAGTWGSVYGWGDCRGSGKWQLKVSCTWGGSATSGVITGPGHVDVKCNIGSARTASIIYS
jgi:hypothetical protein